MNFGQLVRELRESFHSAPGGDKAVTVHLFGIRYSGEIRACGSTVDGIVLEADLPATHAGEIRKPTRIAGHVTLGRDTRRKAPARSPLSGTVLAPAPDG